MDKVLRIIKNYFAEFKILGILPREFWLLNLVVNFFEMLAYFSFITVLTLYLTNNVGFDDAQTGDIMGVFTLMITVIIFIAGPIIDTIGIKKALVISMVILVPTRFFFGATDYIERTQLESSIDVDKAVPELVEGKYHERAFTRRADSFVKAQADLLAQRDGKFGDEELALSYEKDAEKLRNGLLELLENTTAMAPEWEPKLREGITKNLEELKAQDAEDPVVKDKLERGTEALTGGWGPVVRMAASSPDTFKKLVAELVMRSEQVRAKYVYDLKALQGEELKAAAVEIILAYPELRNTYSLQNTLQYLVMIMLFFIALGEGLMVPAIYIAVRRFTNKRTSGAGFNFQYLSMNVAAVLAGLLIEYMRETYGYLDSNTAIMLAGGVFAIICTVSAIILRTNIEIDDEGMIQTTKTDRYGAESDNPVSIMFEVMKEPAFWKFMFFLLLLIGVKLVFTHQFMVMPKYYERVMGHDAHIGFLNSINPSIIVIGLILFIPILPRFKVFNLIIVGTFVSSLSVAVLMIPGKWVGDTFGMTIANGYLAIVLAQIVIFAIGEVIWSPRLSEYTVTIAPKGREGTYMSLAALPMFLAKPLNGFISGRLLNAYCPEDVMDGIVSGSRTFANGPEMMWAIFALIAISSPILVLVFRKFVEGNRSDDDEATAEAAEAT